jgi:hypothetical protein
MRTLTPEELSEQKQRLLARIDQQINKLTAELQELYDAREGKETPQQEHQENRLYNLMKKHESRAVEVTAYQAPKSDPIFELDETKRIEKVRVPTPKKEYKYTEPALGSIIRTKDGREVLWTGFKGKVYKEASYEPTSTQMTIIEDHKNITGERYPYECDSDGRTVYVWLEDGKVKITPKDTVN